MEVHPDTPVRSFMDDPNIEWRTSKPGFDHIDAKYLSERTRNHLKGSLEKTVENLVKTWEMECSHKTNPKDWGSVDVEKYHISTNGGPRKDLAETIRRGNYNMTMEQSPLLDVSKETWESSHNLFRDAFPGGFAWELIDLFSGPPKVTFTWRHWADWTGEFRGNAPTGQRIEMFGMCVAKVNEQLKVTDLEVYFDPNPMLAQLMSVRCPAHK